MAVVSSAGLREDLADDLKRRFPQETFYFFRNIKEAAPYLGEAEIFITYGEDLTGQDIKNMVSLRWIMVISAGMDEMPFEEIAARDILVTNAKGIHAGPMAEYAVHRMLHYSRKTEVVQKQEQEHYWSRAPVMEELRGKQLLIAGAGAIGSETARLAQAFGMHTIGVNASGKHVDHFDQVYPVEDLLKHLPRADFVISVLPKMPETDGLFSRAAFEKMQEHALFINMGRGNAVDDEALIAAVDEGRPGSAVLDVFDTEPLPVEHPFWDHPKITVTPHLSGISPQYQPRSMDIFHWNMEVYRGGEESYWNLVDPEKGY
ncbi:D-2-hydroxyacid dehydrogenase [Alkalicoccus chagannorensis]|uniref:D-2-hydroxyacid dehydrogenase n=1 Tax=Alkalicoccus chagannorensis TaxID=427072 RepID=UPI00047B2EE4|nr:D-2-hydroxyacid dehydrogenase [Alkalicoccus chagannorensis]